jgi:cell division protease FtsH
MSASTKEMVEQEVKDFIQAGYERAYKILEDNNEEFERLAQGLLEYETLTGDEIKRVMKGELPQVDEAAEQAAADATPSVMAVPKTRKRKLETPKADDTDTDTDAPE